MVLVVLVISGILALFLSPMTRRWRGGTRYLNGAPNVPMFCDKNGCSVRPFLHTIERERSIKTNFRWVEKVNEDKRRYLQFFVNGSEYKLLGLIPGNIHLFGLDDGFIHLFGTDASGKDIFSRTLHAIWTSLQVGSIGVFIAFVLALIIGGVSGYYGGWIGSVLDANRCGADNPCYSAFHGNRGLYSAGMDGRNAFFFISLILGLIGWPTLARRVRTHLLTEQKSGICSGGPALRRVVRVTLLGGTFLPSFTSYIIVDLVISFPYMVLSETALSFIGLGLKDPVNSLGVMLQNVTSADVLLDTSGISSRSSSSSPLSWRLSSWVMVCRTPPILFRLEQIGVGDAKAD